MLGAEHPILDLVVGGKVVYRDAHRVDQHGFKLVAPERRTMIVMTFTIELDIGRSFLLQHETTHRRGRSKRSYGHCRRRNEIPEAEPPTGTRSRRNLCHTCRSDE